MLQTEFCMSVMPILRRHSSSCYFHSLYCRNISNKVLDIETQTVTWNWDILVTGPFNRRVVLVIKARAVTGNEDTLALGILVIETHNHR